MNLVSNRAPVSSYTVRYETLEEKKLINDPNPNLANRARIDAEKREIVVPKGSLLQLNSKIKRDGVEYTVRVETESERDEFEKDWNGLQAARKMNQTAVKMGQAADVKIATADANIKMARANIKTADERLDNIREQKRIYILGKLDGINTLLSNKIDFVSNSSFEANAKNTLLQELNILVTKNTQFKTETLSTISLDDLSKKLPNFAQEVNNLSKRIGTL